MTWWGHPLRRRQALPSLGIVGATVILVALRNAVPADVTMVSRLISAVVAGFGVAILVAVYWVHESDFTPAQLRRVLYWTLGGIGGGIAMTSLVLAHEFSAGATLIDPGLELFRVAAFGAAGGMLVGIQDSRRLQERIRAGRVEEVLQETIATAPLPIVTFDPDGEVNVWNEAAEDLFGWTQTDIQGKQYPLVPAEKTGEYQAHVDHVLAGELVQGVESKRQRKDGTLVDVRIWAGPLHAPDGSVRGILGFFVAI